MQQLDKYHRHDQKPARLNGSVQRATSHRRFETKSSFLPFPDPESTPLKRSNWYYTFVYVHTCTNSSAFPGSIGGVAHEVIKQRLPVPVVEAVKPPLTPPDCTRSSVHARIDPRRISATAANLKCLYWPSIPVIAIAIAGSAELSSQHRSLYSNVLFPFRSHHRQTEVSRSTSKWLPCSHSVIAGAYSGWFTACLAGRLLDC